MSALKMAVTLVVRNTTSSSFSAVRNTSMKYGPVAPMIFQSMQARFLHSQDITKNIQYISNEKGLNLEKDPETLQLVKPIDKPLCIMMNWMLAKQKNIHKYAKIYLEQGYDVLSVSCTPWQLLWPMKGSQLVSGDLLRFLEANSGLSPIVVHGFSIGGYVFGELLFHASLDKPRYQPVLDRVAAQIWDSAADISEIPIGYPRAVFPKNKVMQNALQKYIVYHMKTFHESATVHYMRSSQQFHLNLCRAPALFLLSRSDPVGSETSNRRVHDSWKSLGIKTTWKCWDKSPHVSHFKYHTSEYLTLLSEHLGSLQLLSQPEKIQARI